MSSKKTVIMSGAIAAVIAIALIVSATSLGILGAHGSNSTVISSNQSQSGSGTLAVMMTDPPTVPTGVTAVYITYNDVQVHIADAGNNSGWKDLGATGQINLMSVINASQTIASSNIQSGVFNALRFNITGVTVTYQGQNYTGYLVYKEHILTVPIEGGIQVSSAKTSAAMIDLTPTVMLLGDPSNPAFAFIPSAKAYVIPTQQIPANSVHVGDREDFNKDTSIMGTQHMEGSSFAITGVVLTPNSLSITVNNTGDSSVVFSVAGVTTGQSTSGGYDRVIASSQVLVVEPNASMLAINRAVRMEFGDMVEANGYLLAPDQSVTLTYSGPIVIGGLVTMQSGDNVNNNDGSSTTTTATTSSTSSSTSSHSLIVPPFLQLQQPQQVISGDKYIISIIGNGHVAQAGTTALSSTTTPLSSTSSSSSTTTTTLTVSTSSSQ